MRRYQFNYKTFSNSIVTWSHNFSSNYFKVTIKCVCMVCAMTIALQFSLIFEFLFNWIFFWSSFIRLDSFQELSLEFNVDLKNINDHWCTSWSTKRNKVLWRSKSFHYNHNNLCSFSLLYWKFGTSHTLYVGNVHRKNQDII